MPYYALDLNGEFMFSICSIDLILAGQYYEMAAQTHSCVLHTMHMTFDSISLDVGCTQRRDAVKLVGKWEREAHIIMQLLCVFGVCIRSLHVEYLCLLNLHHSETLGFIRCVCFMHSMSAFNDCFVAISIRFPFPSFLNRTLNNNWNRLWIDERKSNEDAAQWCNTPFWIC